MSGRRQTVLFAVALGAMLALAILVQIVRERTYAFDALDEQVLYIRSGEMMQKIGLSYDAVLADIYWIRAIQHYGRERLKPGGANRYDLLFPLLDLTTTLDPRFNVAYRFGAIFLAEPHPGGAGRPDLAIALLKKGIAANPTKADYYHDVGFIYYWNLHDYQSAAEWFRRGGDLPGAPWWLKTYAAVMLTRGGNRQASRAMWLQMRQNEENDWLRQTAELRLLQLDALDQIDTLERLVQEFARRAGRLPSSWEQMVGAGILQGVPVDPSGTPYTLDFTTGDVTVAAGSKLHPLPTEPKAAPELARPQSR
jgi:tetratricopeptide (TPR) repeat protein